MNNAAIRDLLHTPGRHPAFQELVRALLRGETGPFTLEGLTPTAKALYLTLLWQTVERPILVVTEGSKPAETLSELVETFFHLIVSGREDHRPQYLPALDVLPWQKLSPHSDISEKRAIALYRMSTGAASLTIAPAGAALLRAEQPNFYRQLALELRTGDDIPLEDLLAHLDSIGYERREPVELRGEYSVRGGIVDVFPAEATRPVRIEFFGDTIESLRAFDPQTQRSVLKISTTRLLPLAESPRSHELLRRIGSPSGEVYPGWEFRVPEERPRTATLATLMDNPIVIIDEPELTAAAAARMWKRIDEPGRESSIEPDKIYLTWDEWLHSMSTATRLDLAGLSIATPDSAPPLRIPARPSMAFHGNMPVAVAEARTLVESGNRVLFFAASVGEIERLADIFQEYSVPFQLALDANDTASPYVAERQFLAGSSASLFLARGNVRRGAFLPDSQLALFGSEDLFDTSDLVARPPARIGEMGAFAADLADLKPGDYVVHATHGIGQFIGVKELAQGDQKGDFLLLEYAGGSKLYVPLERLDLIELYRGAAEKPPSMDKLGGATWQKTKSRVKAKMRDMAEELLKLYAERRLAEGFSFSPDSNWQREFEDAFEYTATKDQLAAVKDIKRDMESEQPMDRLLCGDVGYGKTEVAMRAAFKALGDGKQVAVLTPTTVLCFQHFETLKRRFAPFPVRVEMVSRFRSAKEIKAVLDDVAEGKVDILVGTHRLFSPDVQFKDLGLLIVDEEQRFGVRHKERLKQMRKNLDVLTMSATPIPRTLHMSMLGLRDLSVIETPPKDRLSINTVVAHFHPELIKTAIEQELARGGQIYFLHNRVDSIFMRASFLQELVPECRIGVGHGQMGESELERVMLGFVKHEFDMLVSTTIVENGLDIPLANTIIIERAERHGLSELYQLRGRVGRSNRRAYAYLLVPEDAELTDVARKRLAALREFSDLGAGFKIAALDLELRGAGNLLGGEQHGHIEAVGYDMYLKLLEQTMQELRGETVAPEIHATLNLGLDLRIPTTYISDETQRLRAYKRIAGAANADEARSILEELEDRYGTPPDSLRLLLRFAVLKSGAEKLAIETIDRRGGAINVKFHPGSQVDPMQLMEVVRATQGASFTPAGVLRVPLPSGATPAALLESAERLLVGLAPK
ncbi:MAG: transcription-repair coupling factor [Bryobacterales bacterium]|nr:transcription-repair coupling factor [Bryobacterales bacterium]